MRLASRSRTTSAGAREVRLAGPACGVGASTSSSTTDASASSPRWMSVRVSSARSEAPSAQRTMIGAPAGRPPGRRGRRPGSTGHGSAGRTCPSVGSPPRHRAGREPRRDRSRAARRGSSAGRRPTTASRDRATAVTSPSVISMSPSASCGSATPGVGAARDDPWPAGLSEARGTQVDVGGVQLVGLGRQGPPGLERRGTIGDEPVRLAGGCRAEGAGVDRKRQLVQGPPRRLRPRRRGRRLGGRGRHPSDPSISSLTSRLNSMAYSIGSSLVNTSRKPWTMRLVASFSVRPRAIR